MAGLEKEAIEALCASHNLFPEAQIVEATIVAGNRLTEYNSDPEKYGMEVDFQDMIELCVKDKEVRLPKFDFVICDECQDFSRLDQLFIEKLIKPVTGRLITIGDPRQSIYSFRGADIHSFEYFENRPNTVTLPLSISYRCPKKVVAHAKKIYGEIEPWEQAKEGKITEKGSLSDIKTGDMVLSRTVRPLVEVFFSLIEQGKKCTIVGKELEEGLLELLNHTSDEDTTEEMNGHLDELLVRKENELSRRGITTPKNHPRYEALEEKISVLERVARACGTIGAVKEMLETIFSDNSFNAIKLMTIHKSKGLEADRVFVIETFEKKKLIPNKYAVTKDQLVQEKNLQFVAVTRAKEELIKIYL
jgi:superfamily I DNA/RNA helicase